MGNNIQSKQQSRKVISSSVLCLDSFYYIHLTGSGLKSAIVSALPLASFVTLDKLPNFLAPQFIIHKMGILMVPTSLYCFVIEWLNIGKVLQARFSKLCCKRRDGKHFRLVHLLSSTVLMCKHHRLSINKWMWVCCSENVSTKTDSPKVIVYWLLV